MTETQYLFGDNDVAARRLELLARIYAESTRAFLLDVANGSRFNLAIDLGCGPSFTTHLLADALRYEKIVGLDASQHFIDLAQSTATDSVAFALHDVRFVPFPCKSADLIFSRLLLSHLKNPAEIVAKWATQLNPRGILIAEEVEAIRTDQPVFAAYLRIVEAMLQSQSNTLYAGQILAALCPSELARIRSDVRSVPVRNKYAARMFLLNMQVWRDSEFVRANYSAKAIGDLEAGLVEITRMNSSTSEIEWSMREAAFSRQLKSA